MLFLNTLHGIYLHTFFADLPSQNLDIRDVVVAGGVGEGGQQFLPNHYISKVELIAEPRAEALNGWPAHQNLYGATTDVK